LDPALPHVLPASRRRLRVDLPQPLEGNGSAAVTEVAPGQRAARREELASDLACEDGGHEHLAVVEVIQQLEKCPAYLRALLLGVRTGGQALFEECVDPALPRLRVEVEDAPVIGHGDGEPDGR